MCSPLFFGEKLDIIKNMEKHMQQLMQKLNDPSARQRPLIMGILNITPDSFHDGGCYIEPGAALRQARLLAEEGADLIDVGAASSRPGHRPVSEEEELRRLLPALTALKQAELPPISIDTDKWRVAKAAVEQGASVINDTSGQLDSGCFEVAAELRAPLAVMHRQGGDKGRDVVCQVEAFFAAALVKADEVGLPQHMLIFDPGIGFNKSVSENAALISAIPRLKGLGRPLLIGYSHKRFAASLSGETPGQAPRGNDILARQVLALGADMVRVHEVTAFLESIEHG